MNTNDPLESYSKEQREELVARLIQQLGDAFDPMLRAYAKAMNPMRDEVKEDHPKRDPLLSNVELRELELMGRVTTKNGTLGVIIGERSSSRMVRDFYERLIDEGRLKEVGGVEFVRHVGSHCSGCGFLDTEYHGEDFNFCPGCGNPIKR